MIKNLLHSLVLFTLFIPTVLFAADVKYTYTPMVNLPGVDPTADFGSYINALYTIAISVAAILAVLKIVIAGVKYMLTDVVSSKGAAKTDIQGAVLGLIIVLGAVVILQTVNTNLTNLEILKLDPTENNVNVAAKNAAHLSDEELAAANLNCEEGVRVKAGVPAECVQAVGNSCSGPRAYPDPNGGCGICGIGSGYTAAGCVPHGCDSDDLFAGFVVAGEGWKAACLPANCESDAKCAALQEGITNGTADSNQVFADGQANVAVVEGNGYKNAQEAGEAAKAAAKAAGQSSRPDDGSGDSCLASGTETDNAGACCSGQVQSHVDTASGNNILNCT